MTVVQLGPRIILTEPQIEQLWVNEGGQPKLAPTMAAIAEAESGGNTGILNDNPGSGDYSVGLWQINYFGANAPGRTARYGAPAQLAADESTQAKAAIDLAAGGAGLDNWSTYKNHAYQQFLTSGPPPTSAAPLPAPANPLPAIPGQALGPGQSGMGGDFGPGGGSFGGSGGNTESAQSITACLNGGTEPYWGHDPSAKTGFGGVARDCWPWETWGDCWKAHRPIRTAVSAAEALPCIANVLAEKAVGWLERFGMILGGAALVLVGLYLVARRSGAAPATPIG